MIKILKFYSNNCAPCNLLEKELQVFDKVESLNVMDNFEKVLEYNVKKAPTTIILKDGIEVDRFVGVKSKTEIEELIKRVN